MKPVHVSHASFRSSGETCRSAVPLHTYWQKSHVQNLQAPLISGETRSTDMSARSLEVIPLKITACTPTARRVPHYTHRDEVIQVAWRD